MGQYYVNEIGQIRSGAEGIFVELRPEYRKGLQALEGFSHINVVWWFSRCDQEELRTVLETQKPYQRAPEVMGIFATCSPVRPNPIALTAVEVIGIDEQEGRIQLSYIDAVDGSPVLDIKPYSPAWTGWTLRPFRRGAATGPCLWKRLRILTGKRSFYFNDSPMIWEFRISQRGLESADK